MGIFVPKFGSGDFKRYDEIFAGLGYELGSVPPMGDMPVFEEDASDVLPEIDPEENISKPKSASPDDFNIDDMLKELDSEPMGATGGLESESLDLGYTPDEEPQQQTEISEEVVDQPAPEASEDMSDFLKELETNVDEPREEALPQEVLTAETQELTPEPSADLEAGDLDLDELLKSPTEDSAGDDVVSDTGGTMPSSEAADLDLDSILSAPPEEPVPSQSDTLTSEETVPELSVPPQTDTDLDALLGLPDEPSETQKEFVHQDETSSAVPDQGMDLDSILGAGVGEETAVTETASTDNGDALFSGDEDFDSQLAGESLPAAVLDDASQPMQDIGSVETASDEAELELSDNDLIKIQNKILTLTPKLQDVARRTIIDETISKPQLNTFVRMLLANKSTDEIQSYLENILGIDLAETGVEEEVFIEGVERRKRPSYIKESFLPLIKVAVLVFVVGLLGFLIYKSFIEPQVEGRDFFVRGIKKINTGMYSEAEDNFRKGEVKIGKKLKWYNEYGLEYRKQKEYDRSIKKFNDGLKLEPGDFDTTINLVETYTQYEKFDKAQNIYRQLLSRYPGNIKVFESLGDLYMFLGDKKKESVYYKKANRIYNKIIHRSWENLNGQFKVLLSHIRMDELKLVKEKFKQILAIKKNAYHSEVLTELAGYYQKKNMWNKSSRILKRIIAADKKNDTARFYAAKFFRHIENYNPAIENLHYSIKYSKNNPVYHNELGEIYMLLPEPNTALAMESFKKAIEIEPRYYKPYINRGDIYYERLAPGVGGDLNLQDSNYDQARWNYEMAEKNLPKDFSNMKFFYNLGWLYYRKGMVETALIKWKNVYDKNPFHPVASFVMGNAYLHLKKTELAIAEYSKVIEYYKVITKKIHKVVPYKKRHKNVYGNLSYAYNNIGIAFERKYQITKNINWEKKALLSFWKARELSEKVGQLGAQYPKYNLKYILRRDVKRKAMAIAPEQRKFNIAKTLYYETY